MAGLDAASEAIFKKCMEGNNPLYSEEWSGWPEDANQDDVLGWCAELSEKLAAFADDYEGDGRKNPSIFTSCASEFTPPK